MPTHCNNPSTTTTRVSIRYFAILRDQRGLSAEDCETSATTVAQLYSELQTKHGLTANIEHLRVSINAEFVDWQQPIHNNDSIVFIPPVAGG